MSTYFARREDLDFAGGTIRRDWYVVDARGQTLGRLATRIADVLRGKHKPIYTPHVDVGDFVVVKNAAEVRLTGNKLAAKQYHTHSGTPGGLRTLTAAEMLRTRPEELIRLAVRGMLPKNNLARGQLGKLKVHRGDLPAHGYAAQQIHELPPVAAQANHG